jgi:beta-galactosidase
MKKVLLCLVICWIHLLVLQVSGKERSVIHLNGIWQFDQTLNAFPPATFTRTIPVPGLVHLANPPIDDYAKFFKRADKAESREQFNLYDIDYTPRYSWYRKTVYIPKDLEGKDGMITIKKSQYGTQVYVNGQDMGTSMACYTPVEFPVTRALKYGAENEILIKVGDRVWLPGEAAGGTDKEKEHYLPGIWDDVELSFTGHVRINRLLVLPSAEKKQVTVKALLRNFKPAQIFYGDAMEDSVSLDVVIAEKLTGKVLATGTGRFSSKRDNLSEVMIHIPIQGFTTWSPDHPFLYVASASLKIKEGISDQLDKQFGMRDFTRKGKFFFLNGERTILRGTNITLQRFFEDPDCGNLVWDREWVKKLLIEYPKQLNWNMMRICVGIVPDFWYDLADEYGLMFQNEWLYWQNHGWDEQIRKEYTDWVWSDGSHPSIAIWDAINENRDDYIGNKLIPELKVLDPTRIWDAGYMTGDLMVQDEMDEPHPYQGPMPWVSIPAFEKNPYPLGNLDYKPEIIRKIQESGSAQLVNEYGWIWLWRNGLPSKLTVGVFKYYLGENSTPEQNRELQAYWLELETEWLRSEPALAGVLAFCYLANNYGYTGDWFSGNIKELKPTPTLEWFRHAFAPVATFINLTDERYTKFVKPHEPGSTLLFNLVGVNNGNTAVTGMVHLKLINSKGKEFSKQHFPVKLEPFLRTDIPVSVVLPSETGGYVLVAEFTPENGLSVISRRFLKTGQSEKYSYFNIDPFQTKNTKK